MAIGATWDPANARDVGQIVGRELAAMGVNLLLGPVVDVLNNPYQAARATSAPGPLAAIRGG